MIKIQNSVPSVYYNSSRDFQLIGHLFDLVLNAVKTDADLLFNLPLSTNSDDQLLELMAYTFVLQLDKTRYTSKQLRAVCSVAPQMMRAKGSKRAVELLCTALMHADGLEDKYVLKPSSDKTELTISLSELATCKEIILEILPYILPAGMIFNVESTSLNEAQIQSNLVMQDSVATHLLDYSASEQELSNLPTLVKPEGKSITAPHRDSSIFTSSGNLTAGLAENIVLQRPKAATPRAQED
jgi:hypothetical protein